MHTRMLAILWMVGVVAALCPPAPATETENLGIRIVPAPGKVVVDGKFDDWDLSGGVFACGDAQTQRDTHAVWFHAMYDQENVYFLARWIDHTPMNNPGKTIGDFGWNGDCLQIRIVTAPDLPSPARYVLNCWKGSDGADVVELDGPDTKSKSPKGQDVKPQGARQAFAVNPDGKGYVQEIAVPWKLLLASGQQPPKAGDKIVLTIEPNFSIGTGGRLTIKDIFMAGVTIDRVFTFQTWKCWGMGTLEAKNGVSPAPVRMADGKEFPVQMKGSVPVIDWTGLIGKEEAAEFIPISFEMPQDGQVSLIIKDKDGLVVRHLLGSQPFALGKQEVKWDGLTTPMGKAPGEPVPAGDYTWEAIWHTGIGLRLRGWASNAGNAPWDDGPASNWGGDMGPPSCAATDAKRVYLGWGGSEAGKALVACDLEANVLWRHKRGGFGGAQQVAADSGVVYVHDGAVLYCLDANEGGYLPWAGTASSEVELARLWPGGPGMPSGCVGLDARAGRLYIAGGMPLPGRDDIKDWPRLLALLQAAGAGEANDPVVAVLKGLDKTTGEWILQKFKTGDPNLTVPDGVVPGVIRALGAVPRRQLEAVLGDLMVKAAPGAVMIVNVATGAVERQIELPSPGMLKVISDDLMYVISSGRQVLAVNLKDGTSRVLIDGLTGAAGLAVDAKGNVYVGGSDNQVKVFDPQGKGVGAIGRAGGRPAWGPWQGEAMLGIAGMTVDVNGRLWVAEKLWTPQRFVVWDTASGKLVRELFGPTHYGASGGAIFPADPDVMVGQGCEWRLDPNTGRGRCTGVFDNYVHGFARFAHGTNGCDYLIVNASSFLGLSEGRSGMKIYQRLGEGDYRLRASVMNEANCIAFWADADGDGNVQEAEVQRLPGQAVFAGYMGWSQFSGEDLSLCLGVKEGKETRGLRLTAGSFTPCKAPVYDLAKATAIAIPGVPSHDNKYVVSCQKNAYVCCDLASGRTLWSYPAPYYGVHGSHVAPPAEMGMIRGSFECVGSATLAQPVGDVWAINSNVGEWHLLTERGFYLARLFQGDPMRVKFPSPAVPGADVTNAPSGMGGEDFGGSMVQGADGKMYIEAGKVALWNVVVTGLDTVKTLGGGKLTLDDAAVRQAMAIREQALQQASGVKRLAVNRLTPTFTGSLDKDFPKAQIVSFKKQDEAAIRGVITWDDQNLYVGWDVKDSSPWLNAADEPAQMYLGGDTVDLQLASDPNAAKARTEAALGDLRLSIGNFKGKPTAVIYRRVSPQKKPRTFSSGVVKNYPMDFVDVVEGCRVEATVAPGRGYVIEAAVPLAQLGISARGGLVVRGDIGATHGDNAGGRTRLRTYWSNQKTGIVDDAVFELKMEPANWGELEFK